jgi:hypothetical protein
MFGYGPDINQNWSIYLFNLGREPQARELGGRVGPKGTSGLSQGNYFFYFVDLKE